MANRTRSRGEKEPTGRTKSAILLYLADNGESTFTDIRTYLAEECNIKSSKDVRIHLEGLASDDRLALIRKVSHGSGNANSYRIREGFAGLKRLHNFLNKHGLVHDFMRTRHFRDYTASADFMTKVRTNLSRNTTLALYESIMDDNKYPGLLSLFVGVADEDRKKLVRWVAGIRNEDRDDPGSGSFFIMLDTIRSEDIDRLGDIFMDFLRLGGIMGSEDRMDEMRMLMFEFDLPQPQRDAFFAILRLSPAAFDYMLNSTSSNPLFPPNPFTAYVLSQAISRLRTGGDVLPEEGLSRWAGYSARLRRSSIEAPIFVIARSLFVSDMAYGRLVGDVPEETLKAIISI